MKPFRESSTIKGFEVIGEPGKGYKLPFFKKANMVTVSALQIIVGTILMTFAMALFVFEMYVLFVAFGAWAILIATKRYLEKRSLLKRVAEP